MRFIKSFFVFLSIVRVTIKKYKNTIVFTAVICCICFVGAKFGKSLLQEGIKLTDEPVKSSTNDLKISNPAEGGSTTTFKISTDGCLILFGYTAQEFVPIADTFGTWTDDFCETAVLDNDGYLLLTLNERQQKEWQDAWRPYVDKAKKCERIMLSEDYTEITLIGYQETIADDWLTFNCAYEWCVINQFLSSKDADSIRIEYTIIDGGTKEIKFQCTRPTDCYFKCIPDDYSSIKSQPGDGSVC